MSAYEGFDCTNCAADHKKDFKLITGLCPVQKVKVMDSGGALVVMLAMIDSGSNTSLLSKNAAERLGIARTATHLTMNLTGGEKGLKRQKTLRSVLPQVPKRISERPWKYTP